MAANHGLGKLVGAVDVGTASVKFLVFVPATGELVTYHQTRLPSVLNSCCRNFSCCCEEVDAEGVVRAVLECIGHTVENLRKLDIDPADLAAIGLSTQRDAVFAWDRSTGRPVSNRGGVGNSGRGFSPAEPACQRRADDCLPAKVGPELAARIKRICGRSVVVSGRPGSNNAVALKLRWMQDRFLNNLAPLPEDGDDGSKGSLGSGGNGGAQGRSRSKELLMLGTLDSWLLYNLTEERVHCTDVSSASLTGLMNLEDLRWEPALCRFYGVSQEALAEIRSSSEIYGHLRVGPSEFAEAAAALRGVPISGCIGDHQAALLGHLCRRPGQAKVSYGNLALAMCNTGPRIFISEEGRDDDDDNDLSAVVAYQLGPDQPAVYGLEGRRVEAGAKLRWLQRNFGILGEEDNAAAVDALTKSAALSDRSVHLVRGRSPDTSCVVLGLDDMTTKADLCKSALESIALRIRASLDAIQSEIGLTIDVLPVDGGLSQSDALMQLQSDMLGINVQRPLITEVAALGAAMVAGLAKGIQVWHLNGSDVTTDCFFPRLSLTERDVKFERWKNACDMVRKFRAEFPRVQLSVAGAPKTCATAAAGAAAAITDQERRVRASVPAAIFIWTSFLLWKISSHSAS